MLTKLISALVVGLIAYGLIVYLVPYLAAGASIGRILVALIAIAVILGIMTDYDFRSLR